MPFPRPRWRSTALLLLAAAIPAVAAFRDVSLVPPVHPSSPWRPVVIDVGDRPSGWGRLQQIAFLPSGELFIPGGVATLRGDATGNWSLLRPGGQNIAFNSRDIGLLIGPTQIRRSEDGGRTWQPVYEAGGSAVAFFGDSVAVASAGDAIVRSSDAGATWDSVVAPKARYTFVAPGGNGFGIAVGGGGAIVLTSDAGATWRQVETPTFALLRGVAVLDARTLIAVGSHGTILRSTDRGETWTGVASNTDHHLRGVAFTDRLNGVAVGFYGTVLRTTDGGVSWTTDPRPTPYHLLGVGIRVDGVPILVGWFGTVLEGRPFHD